MKMVSLCLSVFLLSSCYATRMALDDPMGLPWTDPVLGVAVNSGKNPELAEQLQQNLLLLLPRERHVRTVAARQVCQRANQTDCQATEWHLQVDLVYQSQLFKGPVAFFSPTPGAERLRLQMTLNAVLTRPDGSVQQFSWRQAGDARPEARQKLESQILRVLQQQLIQGLQPRYQHSTP